MFESVEKAIFAQISSRLKATRFPPGADQPPAEA